ncbi:hypothetical protein MXZ82_00290 [Streptococcus uberis]|uniref:lipopolysaccharide biosynthesis protein n=1 Tax=Streptococcus uberis TaxID=1349 RepID=UPI001FF35C84|nr:hypothetical protein [Streptococcus uberis]MCK1160815.1 hypothetical protein [Streptococcus uberis]
MAQISSRTIAKNMILSVFAQIISLITSIIVNLIVPKIIDGYQYAFWQTYILYGSYTGILHLGLLDGIILRYSKYDYEQIDKKKLSSNFWFLFVLLLFFSIIGILFSSIFLSSETKYIFILVSICLVTKNLFMFTSNSFQITNRIKEYTSLIIRQRIIYGIFVIILLYINVKYFIWYCIVDILADIIGFLGTLNKNRLIYKFYTGNLNSNFSDIVLNLKSGISLMTANFSSNLLVGSAKIYVQSFWKPLIFGQVSFGFSITNLFLTFITAISVVLFPSIKRMEEKKLPNFYKMVRNVLTPILLTALLFYFPGSYLLENWLPKYRNSVMLAGVLLPIIIYSTRMSLLTNNYFKAYRLEQRLLQINIISILLELFCLYFSHLFFQNILFVLLLTVLVTVFKSIWSEITIEKIIKAKLRIELILELVILIIFVLSNVFLSSTLAFVVYGVTLSLYLVIFRTQIYDSIIYFKNN